jgi:hypothetical protein
MPEIRARNNRKGISGSVFCLVRVMPIARQRIAKHVSAEEDARSNGTSIGRQQYRLCFPWGPRKVVKRELSSEAGSSVKFSVQLWSDKSRETEAEEFPLLRFVTRKRLAKTLQRNSHCRELLASKDQ